MNIYFAGRKSAILLIKATIFANSTMSEGRIARLLLKSSFLLIKTQSLLVTTQLLLLKALFLLLQTPFLLLKTHCLMLDLHVASRGARGGRVEAHGELCYWVTMEFQIAVVVIYGHGSKPMVPYDWVDEHPFPIYFDVH